ncbi:hypothetical protein [Paraburkholderia rhynchosiae]|uniref:Uncharacterized protein n=1 Tax=Paraburkholderia rhynchosiae TaxID=487049 RepID=A0A6J5CAQ8_9BURK|nr:hypothetical protein [Paraburkholderia rhynchosiae]CAB3731215.1 hypothetical protein LMG27174_05815 [Paraburkholderia rhynchosiae]
MGQPRKPEKPYTWWDDVKYGLGAPVLLLSVPLLIVVALISAL